MNFRQKFDNIVKKNNSLLCVGLDPDIQKLPKHLLKLDNPIFEFNKAIIDATSDLVCIYKPNIAFYEAEGLSGLQQLKQTIEYIKKTYPEIPILLDAKRGDIGNTAAMYAKAMYEYWDVDSVTVFPYLGKDAIEPFLQYRDKLTILLIKTSNNDSKMFQDLPVDDVPFNLKMAEMIAKDWHEDNIGIFVGATYPDELKAVRAIFPNHIFLSAGLGAQEGQVQRAVTAGLDKNKSGIMFNASRSILYASSNLDFATKARDEALKLRDSINKFR